MRKTTLIAKMAMLDHRHGCLYCGWTGDVLVTMYDQTRKPGAKFREKRFTHPEAERPECKHARSFDNITWVHRKDR